MNILTIPSWYATPERPDRGVYFQQMALFFQRAGHQSGIVYADTSLQDAAIKIRKGRFWRSVCQMEQGIPTVRYDGFGWPRRTAGGQDAYARTVYRLFEQYVQSYGRPDIIHAHSYPAAFAAAYIRGKTGIPFVYSEVMTHLKDGQYPRSHKRMLQKAISDASLVSAVSSATAAWMAVFNPRFVEVVPLTVDTQRFYLRAPRPAGAPFVFVNVGDLIERRAPEVAIQAFARLQNRLPHTPLRLDMIGEGYLLPALEQQCKALGIAASVVWHGLQSNDTVAHFLSEQADALLLTSRLETFGVVLIEAMACGLPVISTNSGGPADIVTLETGYLTPVDDAEAIADAMYQVVTHIDSFQPGKIRDYAVAQFGHEAVTRRWVRLFEQVLNR
jgi:glycosyltransferase involved in cell wall biosynthesis